MRFVNAELNTSTDENGDVEFWPDFYHVPVNRIAVQTINYSSQVDDPQNEPDVTELSVGPDSYGWDLTGSRGLMWQLLAANAVVHLWPSRLTGA